MELRCSFLIDITGDVSSRTNSWISASPKCLRSCQAELHLPLLFHFSFNRFATLNVCLSPSKMCLPKWIVWEELGVHPCPSFRIPVYHFPITIRAAFACLAWEASSSCLVFSRHLAWKGAVSVGQVSTWPLLWFFLSIWYVRSDCRKGSC